MEKVLVQVEMGDSVNSHELLPPKCTDLVSLALVYR